MEDIMTTEASLTQSRTLVPESYRKTHPQFCGNPFLDGRPEDIFLKPSAKSHALLSARSTEDLMDAAQRKADKRGFRAVKINSRGAALAVLAGLQ
jgi:hypothetical protein